MREMHEIMKNVDVVVTPTNGFSWIRVDGIEIPVEDSIAPIHDRMPVIVPPGEYDRWLDPAVSAADVAGLLRPYPPEEMDSE